MTTCLHLNRTMLSYRHAFHAGNHADVLKHFIEVLLLQYLQQKDKPYSYMDTHAGAGMYTLTEGYATKNAEFLGGIAKVLARPDAPAAMQPYLEVIRRLNPTGQLEYYPGSPMIADLIARTDTSLQLFELHPSDSKILQQNLAEGKHRVRIATSDGFSGIKACLPPPSRRGLILIDPPYEDKADYHKVITALQEGLKRFATGTYAVWYPLLQRAEASSLPAALKKLAIPRWLDVQLRIKAPAPDGFGMHGSGMFIINPPWVLQQTLESVLPWLVDTLAEDTTASYRLQYQEN